METSPIRLAAELAEHAHDLIAAGVPRDEAAAKLAALAP